LKKILLLLISLAMFLNADYIKGTELSSASFGFGGVKLDNGRGTALMSEADFNLLLLLNVKEKYKGVGLGIGFDATRIVQNSRKNTLSEDIGALGIEIKTGYTLKEKYNIPVYMRIGVGLNYELNNSDIKIQSSADINWQIVKKITIGYKYKVIGNFEQKANLFYISTTF